MLHFYFHNILSVWVKHNTSSIVAALWKVVFFHPVTSDIWSTLGNHILWVYAQLWRDFRCKCLIENNSLLPAISELSWHGCARFKCNRTLWFWWKELPTLENQEEIIYCLCSNSAQMIERWDLLPLLLHLWEQKHMDVKLHAATVMLVLFLTQMNLSCRYKVHRKKCSVEFWPCYYYRAIYPDDFSSEVVNNDLAFSIRQSIGSTLNSEWGGKLITIIVT